MLKKGEPNAKDKNPISLNLNISLHSACVKRENPMQKRKNPIHLAKEKVYMGTMWKGKKTYLLNQAKV